MFFVVKSKRGMMLGALVRGIGFRFGTIGRAAFFDLSGFVVGKLGNFGGMRLFRFGFLLYLINFFLNFFLFFKNRTTGKSVHLRDVLDYFLLLGFNQTGRQRGDLIVVQIGAAGGRQFQGRRLVARRIIPVRGKRAVIGDTNVFIRGYRGGFGLSAGIGEQPTRKSSGEAARHNARASGLRWRRGSSGGP
jgi:hypothetical protein